MLLYNFPDAYDLFYTNEFRKASMLFYKKLFSGKKIRDILDCSVGTGQLTIPLAKLGYNIIGTDLNLKMLNKARHNFAQENLIANLQQSDFRQLTKNVKRDFDCVMTTGNSLANVKNDDLKLVISQMDELLKPGGTLYIDSRNWDNILERKQRFYLYNPLIRAKGRVNYIEVWDYNRDDSMTVNYLFSEEVENKIVSKRQFYVLQYPFKYALIESILNDLQYKNIKVCKLGDTSVTSLNEIDWYVITASKPFSHEIEIPKKNKRK